MWQKLVVLECPYFNQRDEERVLFLRIDYRAVRLEGGRKIEHSFQFGTEEEGNWRPQKYFNDDELLALHNGAKTGHLFLKALRERGIEDNPAAAQRMYMEALDAVKRIEDVRRLRELLAAAILHKLSEQGQVIEFVDGDVNPSPPPPLPPPPRLSPSLGTLGDRAVLRELKPKRA